MRQDVAGRPGDGRDNRPPGAGQPIEQRGLADIGTADEHDGGKALVADTAEWPYLTGSQGLVAFRQDRLKRLQPSAWRTISADNCV